MEGGSEASPIDRIVALSNDIIETCPSCAGKAAEIAVWAREIRERRPSREELTVLVDAICEDFLPTDQRDLLITGLQALVRFAE